MAKKQFYTREQVAQLTKSLNTHKNFLNLSDQTFGRLKVIAYAGKINGQSAWFCQCSCSKIVKIRSGSLRSNDTTSCGCFAIEQSRANNTVHGMTGTPEHYSYVGAIERCRGKTSKDYARYGGRGIEFRFDSFKAFYKEVGPRPSKGYTLDRIDNNGHYEAGNVKWSTTREQAANRRSSSLLTHNGETLCESEWARRLGITSGTIIRRVRSGWCIPCAVTTKSHGDVCPHKSLI